MSVKSVLFGSTLRTVVTVVIGAVVTLATVVGVGFAMGAFGVPTVESIDNSFGSVNESTTVVETNISVDNPNPIGTGFAGVSARYTVNMNGVAMANGSKGDIDVQPGRSDLGLRTLIENEKIPDWWVSHVRNGEETVMTVDAQIRSSLVGQSFEVTQQNSIETDVISEVEIDDPQPIEANQQGVEDPVLYINETDAAWGESTEKETPVLVDITFYNPPNNRQVPIVLTETRYKIKMNGIIVGEGVSDDKAVIPAEGPTSDGTKTVRTRTVIKSENLDEWWVSHLRNNQVTDLRIEISARAQVGEQGIATFPLDQFFVHEDTIETDFFDTKGESGTSGGSSTGTGSSAGDGSDDTPTEDGGSGGETTTDDGVLSDGETTDDGVLAVGATAD